MAFKETWRKRKKLFRFLRLIQREEGGEGTARYPDQRGFNPGMEKEKKKRNRIDLPSHDYRNARGGKRGVVDFRGRRE